MYFFKSAMMSLKKYADFKGRASRGEFWCFFAFVIVTNAVAGFVGAVFGIRGALASMVAVLLFIPQLAVAVRRLHDVGKSGKELLMPGVMLVLSSLAFGFRGILPQIVALGILGIALLAFVNLLNLFVKQGSSVPNRYGGAPTAFSFAG